jgi:uncharacterized membrane protein YccF (DUF307 family)
MRLLLNILWFILGGWISGLAWLLAGVILAITIIGLPFTPAAWRIAGFSFWPFGRIIVDADNSVPAGCLNLLWVVLAGWWLALHHVLIAIPLAISIIGIPFAWQHIKLAQLSFLPVGKAIVEI